MRLDLFISATSWLAGSVASPRPSAGAVPTGAVPTGSVPTGSVPTGSVPTGSVPTGSGATHQQRRQPQGPAPRDSCSDASSLFPDVPAIPAGAWDSHIHVTDPDGFPPHPDARYTPGVHTIWDNGAFENSIHCKHVVIVQPSIYGANNTLLIKSLEAIGSGHRAVVVLDAAAANNPALLRSWHGLGVRGVRVNLQSEGVVESAETLERRLRQYAAAIKPLNWVLQLYTPMALIPSLVHLLQELDVRVVFDHLGAPALPSNAAGSPARTLQQPAGFEALIHLLSKGKTWVKISGPYRLSKKPLDPDYKDLDPIIEKLFKVAPSRLVYGSDWPHTRFEGQDIKPWTRHLLSMTRGDDVLRRKLFTDNAQELWGAK
ncbi:amidohydrolase [Hirsutella rhossiliensis]|uniref:Amidohydrolase domain-containing protein n=1 Tax=Hirsutella rhossiliensis TaxID=111463 RepID=A0A9P8SEN1_9HYPO|nr:amidohydrolase domain-containing protein [Hirsutella rhossiliensis]KAH0960003.1 amidohydrolase domain-containing protein [Hirsutella rhossiliensis]